MEKSRKKPMKRSRNVKNLFRFLSYIKEYRRRMVLSIVLGIVQYNIPVVFPWILKDVIDNVFAGKPGGIGLTFNELMAAAVLLFLILAIISYFRTFVVDRLAHDMTFAIRSSLFQHLQRLPIDFFGKYQTGAISSRLVTDANMAQDVINVAGTNLFMDVTTLGSITAVVFSMSWKLALVAYCSLPLYLIMQKFTGTRMRDYAKESRKRMELIEGDLHETVTGISEVKSFTFEEQETNRFFGRYRSYLQAVHKNIQTQGISLAMTVALTRIPAVLVIWVGGHMVLGHGLTVGSLMAFYAYLEMIYGPLTRLSEINLQVASARAAIDRLFQFLDAEPEAQNDTPPALVIRKAEISFKDVVFGYRPGVPVLKNIHLTIPPGQCIALVGKSGAGKSTMIKLLVRFHDPWKGRILIDGQDSKEVSLPSLRSQIALVQQDPTLFSGSIEDNIRVGRPDATRGEVLEAATFANAMPFIERMPKGLETKIGERGTSLSGGQKQRIAIARAFLKNAPILVLDESTSNLDSHSERLIHQALRRLIQKRTTIIISHRISSVMLADRIAVFHRGELVQLGSHDELIRQDEGVYSRLYGDGLTEETIFEAADGIEE
jgi:ABC-type multidrug transport system fused ATPase/permease subunit